MNLLFNCSRNLIRSPTAEVVFHGLGSFQCRSAGTATDAEKWVDADDIAWADVIFVMEPVHRKRLQSLFGPSLKTKRIVCLNIADEFEYQQPALIDLLWERVPLSIPGLLQYQPG